MTVTAKARRNQVVDVAAEMIEGRIDLLEGCRTIVQLRANLSEPDQSDPDLLVFAAVESELDDVPTSTARQHWEPNALEENERQKAEYLGAARQEILRACHALIERWR